MMEGRRPGERSIVESALVSIVRGCCMWLERVCGWRQQDRGRRLSVCRECAGRECMRLAEEAASGPHGAERGENGG